METHKALRINKHKTVRKVKVNSFYYFIFESLRSGLSYLKKLRYYVLFSFIIFLAIAIFGYFFPIFFREQVIEMLRELVKQTEGLGPVGLMRFIITNNIKSGFFGMLFGFFLGIVPLGILIVNGYVIGFVASKSVATDGIFILWKLLPHGIFEIPAIMISLALGLRIGLFPFYIKEKAKGFLSVITSFVCFAFFISVFYILLFLVFLFNSPEKVSSKEAVTTFEVYYQSILTNPLTSIAFFMVVLVFFIGGIYFGLKILSRSDKKIVLFNIKNSFKVFVLIVIPLLVIAGIIEGLLIWIVG